MSRWEPKPSAIDDDSMYSEIRREIRAGVGKSIRLLDFQVGRPVLFMTGTRVLWGRLRWLLTSELT